MVIGGLFQKLILNSHLKHDLATGRTFKTEGTKGQKFIKAWQVLKNASLARAE